MSRYPLCPHQEIPLGVWCVQCGVWRAVALCVLLAGCGTLPSTAYTADPRDVSAVHDVWVEAGQPPCLPLPTLYVYEATTAERVDWCNSDPPPDACLATPRTGMMRQVYMAVVPPEWPQAFRHETNHMLEACTLGGYDYAHSGPQWSDAARKQAGIP